MLDLVFFSMYEVEFSDFRMSAYVLSAYLPHTDFSYVASNFSCSCSPSGFFSRGVVNL